MQSSSKRSEKRDYPFLVVDGNRHANMVTGSGGAANARNAGVMFEQTLLQSEVRFTWRRTATVLVGFALPALLVGILIMIPVSKPHVRPKSRPQLQTVLVAPPPLSAPGVTKPVRAKLPDQVLRTPVKIPKTQEAPPPPPPTLGVVNGTPGGLPGGQLSGIVGAMASPLPPLAKPHAATPQRVPVSQGVVGALLVHQVMPRYPPSALHKHIQGAVVLDAVISKDGRIDNLRVVQGDPVLVAAATDAVKQWKYKPYILDGQPVEVETIITVNFTLPHG